MDFTNYTAESLNRYFNSLFHGKFVGKNTIEDLTILSFIEEMLTTQLSFNITEKDYNSIVNLLYCMAGESCIIPLPTYEVYDTIMHDNLGRLTPRATENSMLRRTEDGIPRQKA